MLDVTVQNLIAGVSNPGYDHKWVVVQLNTTYISYRGFTNLSTTTCFGFYIGHYQVVLLLVTRLTIQYTV